jgi:septum formation protein
LQELRLSFDVEAPQVDETPLPGEKSGDLVRRLAHLKAAHVASRHPGALVLGADTAVVIDQQILGKPTHLQEARQMLAQLSGRTHTVLTGIVLLGAGPESSTTATTVSFRPVSREEIEWYLSTGEPMDKAGAYALQGIGGFLVQAIQGSHSNVVGLPLAETVALLDRAGYPLPWRSR